MLMSCSIIIHYMQAASCTYPKSKITMKVLATTSTTLALALLSHLFGCVVGFTAVAPFCATSRSFGVLLSSNDDNSSLPRRVTRRRRKRKQIDNDDSVMENFVKKDDIVVPNRSDMVDLEIKDIESLVYPNSVIPSVPSTNPTSVINDMDNDAVDDQDDGDSLKKLLADAKRMRGDTESDAVSEGASIGDSIKNIISTVVTIDFFVICGFLLWFLVGVFSSTVLGNDVIQIAFNGIFQSLVQPALGILMIGSLGSALTKSEDE